MEFLKPPPVRRLDLEDSPTAKEAPAVTEAPNGRPAPAEGAQGMARGAPAH